MEKAGESVFVTGAAGFVGACLARDLIAAGQQVHLLLRPGSRPWRLAGLEGRYTSHPADLRDAESVRRAVRACPPAVIYHLAAHGAYPTQRDRAAILASNVLGTANLLDALDGQEYRMFVNVGSSSEYGHLDRPMREDDRLQPRTDYGVAKAAATLLCQAEALRGRRVATVRIFSAYGPWDDPNRLVPYVMNCCLRGEAPKLTAGSQPRDFIYVEDIVALLRTVADLPRTPGYILHAGSGRQHTVRDMVETIVDVCGGGRIEPLFGAQTLRSDEPAHWVADIEQTIARTGWSPRYDLRAGVERTLAWLNSQPIVEAA